MKALIKPPTFLYSPARRSRPEPVKEMEQAVCEKMLEQRTVAEKETRIEGDQTKVVVDSLRSLLASIRSESEQETSNREKLSMLKDQLRTLEADLDSAHRVKICKEAKHAAICESISAAAPRIEQLETMVQDHKARKDEYGSLLLQQQRSLQDLEEKIKQDIVDIKDKEEAIMWYNKYLGFQTEGGEGVKYIFHNIDQKNPNKEYSFTVRLDESNTFSLLDCNPYVEGTSELITEMNETNGLFNFVRVMRRKFQEATGVSSISSVNADSCSITMSYPPSASLDSRSGSTAKEVTPNVQQARTQSSSSRRRSPRFATRRI